MTTTKKKRTLSSQAQVAKLCRQYLKAKGISCRARSDSFSMGNSVDVTVFDLPPNLMSEIESELGQYQYGHFDGMTDMYENSNYRDDIPQTKYLNVRNEFSATIKQAAWTFIRVHYVEASKLPEPYDQVCNNARVHEKYVSDFVYQVLSGYETDMSKQFWDEYSSKNSTNNSELSYHYSQETGLNITIREGTRPGYTEVLFDTKPGQETRDSLKAAGFRWSRHNGVWYGKTENLPSLEDYSEKADNNGIEK